MTTSTIQLTLTNEQFDKLLSNPKVLDKLVSNKFVPKKYISKRKYTHKNIEIESMEPSKTIRNGIEAYHEKAAKNYQEIFNLYKKGLGGTAIVKIMHLPQNIIYKAIHKNLNQIFKFDNDRKASMSMRLQYIMLRLNIVNYGELRKFIDNPKWESEFLSDEKSNEDHLIEFKKVFKDILNVVTDATV